MLPDFIGTDEAGEPVILPDAIRCEHVTIIGATGTGKTTLLERMILSDIENEISCALIDAHGDLTENILRKTPAASKDRMYLLEVSEDRPFGLNLLERGAQEGIDTVASEVLLIFKRMFEGEAEFRPQLDNDLDLLIHTLLANEGYTLAEALELLYNKSFRDRLTRRLTSRAHLVAWEEYDALSPRDRSNRNAPLFNRLNPFLASQRICNIVGQSKTTVPFKQVMDTPGQALLVKLPVGGQGSEMESKFLGNLFVCQLARLIFRRAASSNRNRFHLYLDEYGRYATPTTARLFTDIRKYQVGLTVAHQTMADVGDEKQKTAELQAGTLVCFHPASGSDADELARSMRVTPRPAEEPPRAISQSPIQQLLEGKHESRPVQDFAVKFLHSLTEDPKATFTSPHKRDQLADGLELLNALLIDVMKGDLDIASSDFYTRAAEIAGKCAHFIGLSYPSSALSIWDWDLWTQALVRRIAKHDPDPIHDPEIQALIKKDLEKQLRLFPQTAEGHRNWYERRKELLRSEAQIAYPFFVDLIRLCQLLQREPVYVSVPGHIGRPRQTYADAQAELANNIRDLPKHHAYVRLRTNQGVYVNRVRLCHPVSFLDVLSSDEELEHGRLHERWVAWQRSLNGDRGSRFYGPLTPAEQSFPERLATQKLRKRCLQDFGVPRDEVETEIRRRLGHGDEGGSDQPARGPDGGGQPPSPVSPPLKPTIGRRPPKQ